MELKALFESNPALLLKREHVRSVLNDVLMNDVGKVNLMMTAYSIGIVNLVRNSPAIDHAQKARWVMMLVQHHAIVEEKAKWAVDSWVACISPKVLDGLAIEEARLSAEKIAAQNATRAETLPENTAEASSPAPKYDDLEDRESREGYYVNPSLDEREDRIYVPCGIGNTDNGFFIYGIKKALLCNHPAASIYALVYNFLVRNSRILHQDIPKWIRGQETVFQLDYRSIFRFAVVLLQIIKNNLMTGSMIELNVRSHEEQKHIQYALGLINNYAAMFCRLSGLRVAALQIRFSAAGLKLTARETSGIHMLNNTEILSNARELWLGQRINYSLSQEHLTDLEYILSEISSFDSFREGQYAALCAMLKADRHTVCIMPTGSGKSLIYYLASLLQPLPFFIVAPTEILIKDQIRNLKAFHHMDNVAHLMLTDENSFDRYKFRNSMNFVTPMTLQNRNILVMLRHLNNGTEMIKMKVTHVSPGSALAGVVLDEIHCLSNWGHDFRPEYLMLSQYLNRFLDQVRFWGFTATANLTVIQDIQKQLGIPVRNFLSPLSYEKFNITYHFHPLDSTEAMYRKLAEVTSESISLNQRTLIFTKSEAISRKAADHIGYEAGIFTSENPVAYHRFAEGKSRVLLASEELGIGINLPDIRCVVHFGLPLSKSEYVQQIGRAGRSNEQVSSHVIFLSAQARDFPGKLMQRNTTMAEIPALLEGLSNDYGDIYRRLTNSSPTRDDLFDGLRTMQEEFHESIKGLAYRSYRYEELEKIKRYLYMLYITGYVNDWQSLRKSAAGDGVDIMVDIKSGDSAAYDMNPNKMLNRMKERLTRYFDLMGDTKEEAFKTNNAQTIGEIISVYVNWYYNKYLYQHNEQFLDLYEFIIQNIGGSNEEITEQIKAYFNLPFQEIRNDEVYFKGLSLKEIFNKAISGLSRSTAGNIERINSSNYSYKLDYLLLCFRLLHQGIFEEDRLNRLAVQTPREELPYIRQSLQKLYGACELREKLAVLNWVSKPGNLLRLETNSFLRAIYSGGEKDLIYYALMAKKANIQYASCRRTGDV